MAVIVFLLVVAVLLCVRGLWAYRTLCRSGPARGTGPAGRAGSPAPVGHRGVPWAEELEGLLVAARLAGALERHEYQEAMARLARADEARSPLRMPPPGGG